MTAIAPLELTSVAKEIAQDVIDARADGVFKGSLMLHEMKWNIGAAVVTNPKYKKYAKGQGELLHRVANIAGIEKRTLEDCITFFEHYRLPSFEDVIPKLPGEKTPVWRETIRALRGRREEKEIEPRCKKCSIHCHE